MHVTANLTQKGGLTHGACTMKKAKIIQRGGFTLIELLVVIAIIGLLSTLAIVSLNSSREKARNAKRLADIKNYVTSIETYRASNTEYPDSGNTSWSCLGDHSDGQCWNNNSVSENATLLNILDDTFPDLPTIGPDGEGNCSSSRYEGAIYRCTARTNGLCSGIDIRWFMENTSQSCGPGSVISNNYNSDGCTYCRYP